MKATRWRRCHSRSHFRLRRRSATDRRHWAFDSDRCLNDGQCPATATLPSQRRLLRSRPRRCPSPARNPARAVELQARRPSEFPVAVRTPAPYRGKPVGADHDAHVVASPPRRVAVNPLDTPCSGPRQVAHCRANGSNTGAGRSLEHPTPAARRLRARLPNSAGSPDGNSHRPPRSDTPTSARSQRHCLFLWPER
jgi:hypothetical protein